VSVYGTGHSGSASELFLAHGLNHPVRREASPSPCGTGTFIRQRFSLIRVSPTIDQRGCRNIKPASSIVYALRPRLRSRLTLGGRTFPRKPWVYGGQEFNLSCRYSCLHPHFRALHGWFPYRFTAPRTLSYHAPGSKSWCIRSFGIPLDRQSFSAPSLSMSQLLRTV
jgi:hypothetical protein